MLKKIAPILAKLLLFTLAVLVFLLSSCNTNYRNCGPNKGLLVTTLSSRPDGLWSYRAIALSQYLNEDIEIDFIDSAYKYKQNDTIYFSKNR